MSATLPLNDIAYSKLVAALRLGPVALVGSGLSVASGYPSWSALLEELRAEADQSDPRPPKQTNVVSPVDDKLWEAQEYRDRIGEGAYRTFLSDRFRPNGGPLSESIKTLVRLPFKAFMTTNYDTLITQAIETTPQQKARPVMWSNQFGVREFFHHLNGPLSEERSVLHLHGRYDDPGSIVLTEFDYVAQYAASDVTTRRLFALFSTQCLIFVGFSLSDPDLMALLREVQATLGPGRPRHFAILPLTDPDQELQYRRLLERKYGITPCFYVVVRRTKSDGTVWNDHTGLGTLLQRMQKDATQDASVHNPVPAAQATTNRSAAKMADPHKGAFGGLAQAHGRRLSAAVVPAAERHGWFSVEMTVESTDSARPLAGPVVFHLHPSFRRAERSVAVVDGKASLRLLSYGAFTVGVVADGGATRLELDLAELPAADPRFKSR